MLVLTARVEVELNDVASNSPADVKNANVVPGTLAWKNVTTALFAVAPPVPPQTTNVLTAAERACVLAVPFGPT